VSPGPSARGLRRPLREELPILGDLVALAVQGLSRIDGAEPAQVPFTYRAHAGPDGPVLTPEGSSLRYAAIAALGLSRIPERDQRFVLGGRTAADFATQCQAAVDPKTEAGAAALALWAAAEVAGTPDLRVADQLLAALAGQVDTVVVSWMITAAIAVGAGAERLRDDAAARLLEHTGEAGIFPHTLPPARGVRGHVGCFADQVYPIQSLSRLSEATGDVRFRAVADRTAARIVSVQGAQGQWWWHYDHRDGSIVERFPVYSVHQYGMAPMVLMELAAAGGADQSAGIASGVRWLSQHPECVESLLAPHLGVVWRKVGRRELAKASRAVGAVTTAIRPGFHLPGLDRILRPGVVDHECRPYELGWLLYAWGEGDRGVGSWA